jgi:ribonuclease VapC
MIAVDSSAVVAIVAEEEGAAALADRIADAGVWLLPSAAYLETVMVLSRTAHGRRSLDLLIGRSNGHIAAIDEPVARLAADAFERYGLGRAHPARLTFGDCLVYAVAKALDLPLLFKGGDFALTDVVPAL